LKLSCIFLKYLYKKKEAQKTSLKWLIDEVSIPTTHDMAVRVDRQPWLVRESSSLFGFC
jgi:hypothetical protein